MKLIINKNDQTLLTKLIDNKINDTANRLENVLDILINEKSTLKWRLDKKIRLKNRKQELADRLRHYKKLYGKINNA